jgi:mercuric ion binding protein
MKTLSRILLFVALSFSALAASAQTKEVTIKVGFLCDHYSACETGLSKLEKQLMFTKGIKAIKWNEKSVTLQYNEAKTNEQLIRAAIAKAGYDADEVKADPKGYEKLDGCCKKKS